MSGPDRAALESTLRERLLSPEAAMALTVRGRTDAAVLVALYLAEDRLNVVLTRRRENLRRHAGEISFPGGRREDDDPDLLATALRETDEEIGLHPGAVTVLGALQPTPTVATGYAVYPFVGMIEARRAWTPQETEVAEVIELELGALAAGAGRRGLVRRGLPIRTDTYVVGDHLVWGATARILADLLDRLAAADATALGSAA